MAEFEFIRACISEQRILEIEKNRSSNVGATCIFKGTVRADELEQKTVHAIEFTSNEELATETAIKLLNVAKEKFALAHASILHSLGKVEAGDVCFYVSVMSAHRKESFAALPWIVNEFKELVPIFGKELMEDGTYVWKTNKK